MHELAPLILDLTIMLGVAAIVVLLFQRIRQPVVLGYLVAGMLIGPYITNGFVSDIKDIKTLSELGVIFLMFSLGLEFSFNKLTKVGFSAVITGIFDVSMMLLIGYAAGALMGWDYHDCLFLAASLAISSTTIIYKAINELNLQSKRFAEVIFGVLIVEDLLAILLLVALSTLIMKKNVMPVDLLFASGKLVLVVGGWFLIGYSLVPTLFRRLSTYVSQETLTIVSVALCLFLVSLAAYFHYSTALGAFIMGSILAETVLVKRIEEIIVPIRDIFGAVFFISVGMLINPAMIVAQWYDVLLISLVLIIGKITVISLGTFLTGQSVKTSVRAGFGMAQIGEFSFIIATLGVTLHAINDTLYPLIVAISGITTFTTPYMIRLSGVIGNFLEKRMPTRVRYFLNSYSTWVFRVQNDASKSPQSGGVTVRLFLNAITIAIIFTIINKLVFPEIYHFLENKNHAKIACEILAVILSSPFIWGMIFSYRFSSNQEYAKMRFTPIAFIVWLVTLFELSFLSVVYFHTWATTAIFIAITLSFFAIAYRTLEKSYYWFEAQLVRNINKRPVKKGKFQELAPWDTHFVEMEVGDKSIFLGKSLGESQIRQRFGVNIVAIYRGHVTMFAPRGEVEMQDGDKLIVLGTDEQIERFRRKVTLMSTDADQVCKLENYTLKPITLQADDPRVGKTIRTSHIREQLNGLVVGIERGNNRILNPDPDTKLMADDLLLFVGLAQ